VSGRRGVSWISAFVLAVNLVVLLAACTSEAAGAKPLTKADAYAAAINWYVDSLPAPPPTTDGDTPGPVIVYVVSETGKAINSQVQASVVADLADRKDDVTVRFADVRDDALDVDVENQPVKDGGVLLLVGEVDERPPPVDLNIDVYRTVEDDVAYSMKIHRTSGEVTVTAQTVVEPG
jgi:hypothetical protein